MKKNFLLLSAMALSITMASCSSDDQAVAGPIDLQQPDQIELGVNKVGVEQAITRSGISATAFSGTESLGLFIFDQSISSGAAQAADNYLKGGVATPTLNIQYQRTVGTSVTWEAATPIILSSTVGKVYAYYPWAEGNTNATAIPVTVAADQGTGQSDGTADANGQTDYMWATPVADKSNAAGAANHTVDLTMNHALAMVSFNIQQAASAADLYPGLGLVSSIVLENTAAATQNVVRTGSGTMNLNNGTITKAYDALDANAITVVPTNRTAAGSNMVQNAATVGTGAGHKMSDGTTDYTQAYQPRVLVYPFQDDTNGIKTGEVQVTATVDGSDYTVSLPAISADNKGWLPGYNYLYTLTMKGTGLVVEDVTITAWVPSVQGEFDLNTPNAAP